MESGYFGIWALFVFMVGKIKGTGSYRPVQVWDNDKLSHMMDTSDEWIRGRTGIGQRHIASGGETVAYMAARAAEEALSDAGMRPEEIDLLLVSTMSSERIMPCAACEVQKLIGAVNAACFDLNGACTGFLLALNTAQAYLGQQIYRRALVIGSETLSHLTNWKDRSTCVLFGDGAGAVSKKTQKRLYDDFKEAGIYPQVSRSKSITLEAAVTGEVTYARKVK